MNDKICEVLMFSVQKKVFLFILYLKNVYIVQRNHRKKI